MAAERYSSTFYVRNLRSSITPSWKWQASCVNPHGPHKGWIPARWLPIAFSLTDNPDGTDYYVISSGKIVALDAEGRLVPAGLREALVGAATSTVVLTYTATDVEQGVYDIETGRRLTAAKTVTSLAVAKALINRGLVDRSSAPSTVAHIREVIRAFISRPVGISFGNVYVYSGQPADGDQTFTNYSKQHVVQFVTEHEVRCPRMSAGTATEDTIDVSAVTLASSNTSGTRPADGTVLNATGTGALGRWNSDDVGDVVTIVLSVRDVAAETDRTPLTCDVDHVLLRSRTSIALVAKAGDYYLDAAAGYLVIHRDTWDTLVTDNDDPTISFYAYSDSALAASTQFIYFTGTAVPGDLMSVDKASNFCRKGSTVDILDSTDPNIGRFMGWQREPFDLMANVKSGVRQTNAPVAARVPGSATKGYSDMITLANELVADSCAIILFRIS